MRRLLVGFTLATLSLGAATQRTRGMATAPMMLEVFSDYQCPSCKALYEKTLVPLIADYVDKGKIYLIHHEFPLPMHQYAMRAAYYAVAANRVGKYDQVTDILFRQQDVWSANGDVDGTVTNILSPADAKKVRTLAKDPEIVAEVQQDVQLGHTANISSTPTMILTYKGKQYRLPSTNYNLLRQFIDQLLSK